MRLARSYSRRRRPHRDRRQRSSIRNRQALTREPDSKENRMGLQIVGAVIGALKKVSEWFGVRYSPPCITARRGMRMSETLPHFRSHLHRPPLQFYELQT